MNSKDALEALDEIEKIIKSQVGGSGWDSVFASIRQALTAAQWQTIDSAPKTGERILLSDGRRTHY